MTNPKWLPKERVALVDGDIVAYSTAWAPKYKGNMVKSIDYMLHGMGELLALNDLKVYLTGKGNFRKTIDPNYKLHRKDKPKPEGLQECFDYLTDGWGAEWCNGFEADDALGINATAFPDYLICTTDKDLNQIPGFHYNWSKNKVTYIDQETANKSFWMQMLTGDRTDNVPGVAGIGPVKATQILKDVKPDIYYPTVLSYYKHISEFKQTYKLLKILTTTELEANWKELEYIG